jgi:hypothetical protein
MKWEYVLRGTYQVCEGAKAYRYYYIWKEGKGKWRAGRYTLGREVDFLAESFATAKLAREYCERYDRVKASEIIEGVTA